MSHENEIHRELDREQKGSSGQAVCNGCDLIVVGAGPAGLFCAINACQSTGSGYRRRDNRRILLIERNPSPGRKLLISGSGQCNITHEGDIRAFLNHYGDHGRFLRPSILGFTNHDLISYFKERGLEMISEPGGKIFPQTRRARDILNILIEDCRNHEIEILCQHEVRMVQKSDNGFRLCCEDGEYRSDLLVIATGGCSYPATGSTGDGYRFARSLGHSLTEIGPALTPLPIKDNPFYDLAGISFEGVKISLHHQGKTRDRQGDVLITHEGLSGPAVLDLSRYVQAGDILKLSLVPPDKRGDLDQRIMESAGKEGSRSVRSILSSLSCSFPLPTRLIDRILLISGIDPGLTLSQLRREERMRLVENLVGLPLTVSKPGGFEIAMVTRGGVDWKEVDPKTMQSRLVRGLYLVGEVLDVDGDTGGYNLQACFSTAMLAARSIKKCWDGKI